MSRRVALPADELLLLARRTTLWTGPHSWGWRDGRRLSLAEALAAPGFG